MSRLRRACGPFFVLAGAMHFAIPRTYEKIVPPYIPAPGAMVALSGVAEMAGGAGLMVPPLRRRAGLLLLATMLAVFPANLHMAQHPEQFPLPGGERALKARLPLQLGFLAWILAAMRQPIRA
jgi:uncharacterized membrane protein